MAETSTTKKSNPLVSAFLWTLLVIAFFVLISGILDDFAWIGIGFSSVFIPIQITLMMSHISPHEISALAFIALWLILFIALFAHAAVIPSILWFIGGLLGEYLFGRMHLHST